MKKSTPPPVSPVQDQALGLAANNQAAQTKTLDTQQSAISPYLAGSTGQSAFGRALTGSLAHSTANTGDSLMAGARRRAQAAGFGGDQPITAGAQDQIANEQAGRIAQIPAEVQAQEAPLAMQAAGQEGTIAQAESPANYFDQGASLAGQNQQALYQQMIADQQKKAGIWGALAGTAGTILGGPLGGAIAKRF